MKALGSLKFPKLGLQVAKGRTHLLRMNAATHLPGSASHMPLFQYGSSWGLAARAAR